MTQESVGTPIVVTVKIFGGLRDAFTQGEFHLQLPATAVLSDVFDVLGEQYPDEVTKMTAGIDAGYLNVLVNGRNVVFLDGRRTELSNEDSVAILPPVGGG
jgi:MoaD family protein